MKRLGVTQRVVKIEAYGEIRDCLDQKWMTLAESLDFALVPLPTMAVDSISPYIDALHLDAIILSGGNSLSQFDPSSSSISPERDAFEFGLIDGASTRSLPLLGVCRGMQVINVHFGGQLRPITGHAGCRHDVQVGEEYSGLIPTTINSYHDWAIGPDNLAPSLNPIVHDSDGNIEAFVHESENIAGIMWHPEREDPFNPKDIELLEKFLR